MVQINYINSVQIRQIQCILMLAMVQVLLCSTIYMYSAYIACVSCTIVHVYIVYM